MIRRAGLTLWRAFAVEKKDIEAVVSAAILSRGPIPLGKHPLTSTFDELQMDEMDQAEAAAGSMHVLGYFSDNPPEVQSGQQLVQFLQQLIEKSEERKKEKKEEDED